MQLQVSEEEAIELQKNMLGYYELKSPLRVQVEITMKCNYCCPFCYTQRTLNTNNNYSMKDYLNIIDDLNNEEVMEVSLTGGEPFANKPLLFSMVEKLENTPILTRITTNGSLIREQDVNYVKNASFLVSFRGFKAHQKITGANDVNRVVDNIKMLWRNKCDIRVNFVATPQNIDEFEDAYNYFTKEGIEVCLTRECDSIGIKHDYDNNYLEKLHGLYYRYKVLATNPIPFCFFSDSSPLNNKCTAGFLNATIGINGKIRPCTHADYEGANVFEVGLKEAYKSLGSWRSAFNLPINCQSCSLLSKCGGGCRVAAYAKTQSYWKDDPLMKKKEGSCKISVESTRKEDVNLTGSVFMKNPAVRFRKEKFGYVLGRKNNISMAFHFSVGSVAKMLWENCNGCNEEEIVQKLLLLGCQENEARKSLRSLTRRGMIIAAKA